MVIAYQINNLNIENVDDILNKILEISFDFFNKKYYNIYIIKMKKEVVAYE